MTTSQPTQRVLTPFVASVQHAERVAFGLDAIQHSNAVAAKLAIELAQYLQEETV